LCALVSDVLNSNALPAAVRDWLVLAIQSDPPLTSVDAMARAAKKHRSSLHRQWRRLDTTLRLEDLVSFMILFRAGSWKTPRKSWAEIAGLVGVSERALRKMARRHMNIGLADLPARPGAALARLRKELPHASGRYEASDS
jgi:hypothetical protein